MLVDAPNVAYPRGVRLELHPSGDHVSDVIRETGDFYEADILDEIARRVSGGVLIDVGAHIGNHTAYLAQFVPYQAIHAFEPLPVNLPLLRRNIAPYQRTYAWPLALSDRDARATMTVGPNLGHAMLGQGDIEVETRTLDSYRFAGVTLLKIDVEGHEPQVLAGARGTIERWRPLIVIEDWKREYAPLLPGYEQVAEWETAHQTFMYEAKS